MKKNIMALLVSAAMSVSVITAIPEKCALTSEAASAPAAKKFMPRLTAPSRYSPYYFDDNTFYNTGYGMPNCTCYAFGRAYELLGKEPMLSHGDGGTWYERNIEMNAYPYGSVPKLGAIACWSGGYQGGHVAVVEEINGSELTLSHSSWMGEYFKTEKVARNNMDNIEYNFQGYIYIGNWSNDPADYIVRDTSVRKERPVISEDSWMCGQFGNQKYEDVRDKLISLLKGGAFVEQCVDAIHKKDKEQ